MRTDSFDLVNENLNKRHSLILHPTRSDSNVVTNNRKLGPLTKEFSIQRPLQLTSTRSIPDLSSKSCTNNTKTRYVQLYKPIYMASRAKTAKGHLLYDEGDEFELLNKIDEVHFRVLHLRTNIEFKIRRTRLRLDPETPLRLGSDDRNIIERCLFEYNLPGAYLIRRSHNEPGAFVLSISQISARRNIEDYHYLIRTDVNTRRFYFDKECTLAHLSFSSFQKLIHNGHVLKNIPLSIIMPFGIDFEDDFWHILRRHLTLEHRIGQGYFGEVWRAVWKNDGRLVPVAVKKLHSLGHDKSNKDSFIQEIETMKSLRNNYIVTFFGISQDHQTKETLLVTELMENGDLKNWLQSLQDVPDEKTIIAFAHDISQGMSCLEQNNLVHRDLACRNLLISVGRRTIKIADFGLSTIAHKNDFTQREKIYSRTLPIRWTAPEVLRNGLFYSIKSDVWSYGIVLIELWLKGDDPYPEEKELQPIETLVLNGYVHKKPVKCSNQFYNRLILPCLCFQLKERPSFKSLAEILTRWNKEKAEYERLNSTDTQSSS